MLFWIQSSAARSRLIKCLRQSFSRVFYLSASTSSLPWVTLLRSCSTASVGRALWATGHDSQCLDRFHSSGINFRTRLQRIQFWPPIVRPRFPSLPACTMHELWWFGSFALPFYFLVLSLRWTLMEQYAWRENDSARCVQAVPWKDFDFPSG